MTTRDTLRKKILYRASRRGMRELDVVLGAWVRASLSRWQQADLKCLERILAQNEPDLLEWIWGAPPRAGESPQEKRLQQELQAFLKEQDRQQK